MINNNGLELKKNFKEFYIFFFLLLKENFQFLI
jgi:hypothetical protein